MKSSELVFDKAAQNNDPPKNKVLLWVTALGADQRITQVGETGGSQSCVCHSQSRARAVRSRAEHCQQIQL